MTPAVGISIEAAISLEGPQPWPRHTGRRSGRRYTIPVGYQMADLQVTITVSSPDHKVWWRSLTGKGAPVELSVRGRRRTGHAVATRTGDQALVRVALDR
jgi:hypothetical protein